jgi:hypothetical protein
MKKEVFDKMLNSGEFENMFKENKINDLLNDGSLSKEQIDKLINIGKKLSKDEILRRQRDLAKQPGYKEHILSPLIKKIVAQQGRARDPKTGRYVKQEVINQKAEETPTDQPESENPNTDKTDKKVEQMRQKFKPKKMNNMFSGSKSGSKGTAEKSGTNNINTDLYSKIGMSRKPRLNKNDNTATIATKIYSILKNDIKETKLRKEIKRNFGDNNERNEKRRHKELLEALGGVGGSRQGKPTKTTGGMGVGTQIAVGLGLLGVAGAAAGATTKPETTPNVLPPEPKVDVPVVPDVPVTGGIGAEGRNEDRRIEAEVLRKKQEAERQSAIEKEKQKRADERRTREDEADRREAERKQQEVNRKEEDRRKTEAALRAKREADAKIAGQSEKAPRYNTPGEAHRGQQGYKPETPAAPRYNTPGEAHAGQDGSQPAPPAQGRPNPFPPVPAPPAPPAPAPDRPYPDREGRRTQVPPVVSPPIKQPSRPITPTPVEPLAPPAPPAPDRPYDESVGRRHPPRTVTPAPEPVPTPPSTTRVPGPGASEPSGKITATSRQVSSKIGGRESNKNIPEAYNTMNRSTRDVVYEGVPTNIIERGNIDISTATWDNNSKKWDFSNAKRFTENLSEMSIGEVIHLQEERNKKFQKSTGGTAAGRYQFIGQTLKNNALLLFGPNYKNIQFSEVTQELLQNENVIEIAEGLKASGIPITEKNIYMGHFNGIPFVHDILNPKYKDKLIKDLPSWSEEKTNSNESQANTSVENYLKGVQNFENVPFKLEDFGKSLRRYAQNPGSTRNHGVITELQRIGDKESYQLLNKPESDNNYYKIIPKKDDKKGKKVSFFINNSTTVVGSNGSRNILSMPTSPDDNVYYPYAA